MAQLFDPKTKTIHRIPTPAYLLLNQSECISDYLRRDGDWEAALWNRIQPILSTLPATATVLDIGANLGTWTTKLARAFPNGKVWSFECQRDVFYQLCGNIFINRLHNVEARRMALGAPEQVGDVVQLRQYPHNIGMGRIASVNFFDEKDPVNTETVTLTTLDSMIDEIGPVGFIKIDIEGFELPALRGAEKLIRESKFPPILFESWIAPKWDSERDQLHAYLRSLGYTITHISADDWLAIH